LKKAKKYLFLIGINTLVFFFLLELILHLVPLEITEYHSTYQYKSDDVVGYLPVPNQDGSHNMDCIRNPHIVSNSLGMRGEEWRSDAKLKIALLGDSFLHALTIPDKLHVSTKLSQSTNSNVWNGGVSGYGTYQELLLWRKLMKARKPDITIVFLYLENDIRDNQCKLCRAEGQVFSPCCEVVADIVIQQNDFEIRKPTEEGWKAWLKRNCYTSRMIRNLFKSETKPTEAKQFFETESFAYNVYRPNLSESWKHGWKATAWALQRLKEECDGIGSKLLVVSVPGVIQLSTDWKAEMKTQLGSDYVPTDFNLNYPIQQLHSITDSAGIDLLDLQPAFMAYRDKYKLANPVFGWCCDGHWNPLGHQLAADLIQNYLVEKSWSVGLKKISTPSPIEVLGEKLFKQIYNCEMIEF
jgi:hypothetical protein